MFALLTGISLRYYKDCVLLLWWLHINCSFNMHILNMLSFANMNSSIGWQNGNPEF